MLFPWMRYTFCQADLGFFTVMCFTVGRKTHSILNEIMMTSLSILRVQKSLKGWRRLAQNLKWWKQLRSRNIRLILRNHFIWLLRSILCVLAGKGGSFVLLWSDMWHKKVLTNPTRYRRKWRGCLNTFQTLLRMIFQTHSRPVRNIQQGIDLVPEAQLLNLPACHVNPMKYAELKKQV